MGPKDTLTLFYRFYNFEFAAQISTVTPDGLFSSIDFSHPYFILEASSSTRLIEINSPLRELIKGAASPNSCSS